MPNDAVSNLGKWLWYLVPANPILVRVVHGGSRRSRHLLFRFGYLVVLFCVFFFSFLAFDKQGSLSDLARTSTQIFRLVAYAQLLLMCFLAPVFTAGAITQERDAETFNILLTTPLSNAQIIFGSLLSRLFFVLLLLFSGLPIFCITMIYGGVTFAQIVQSFAIAGATALLTGSLAIMISMIRVGTRRTIFSFGMAIGLYLLVIAVLGKLPVTFVAEAPMVPGSSVRMSWLAAFHPFLALEVGLNSVPAPTLADVAIYGWPTKYLLAYPHVSYVVITLLASLAMICFSMLFVRSGASEGEPTLFNRLTWRFRGSKADFGDRRRKPSRVWTNPIAWREARTKAAAASSVLARYGMLIAGVAVSLVILVYLAKGWLVTREDGTATPFGLADARVWLMRLVMIEFGLILLVVTNASASSMTRERESNSMDILLSTPLTSKQIMWGKLRGLVAFAVPMMAVPLVNLITFLVYDLVMSGRNQEHIVHFEAVLELAGLMLVFTALACVIGLQTSLKSKKTVRAVLVSISIVTLVCALLSVIVDAMVQGAADIGPVFAPFTPYTAVKGLVNGVDSAAYSFRAGYSTRVMAAIGSLIAIGVYAAIVAFMYNALVRGFDMTVRKQTAS